ncbi:D-alanyl-D-alanine carboxypeptidase family protein [Clostridium perfringens]
MSSKKIKKLVTMILLASQLSFAFAETSNINTTSETSGQTIEQEQQTTENIDSETNSKLQEFNNTLSAEAYVVIDSKTGEKIMGKNEDEVMYPASLTKIVTSLLLLESGKLDEKFIVSKEADEIGEASIYATEGEELSGKDLLYAMMLQSANDACYVVAEGVSGTAEEFYKLMTKRAKELGAKVSNFSSANGLHEEDHVTSAMDLALITKEALKFPEFREAIKSKTYSLTRTSESGMKEITNKNRMLFENKPEYNSTSIGGKTAYTRQAGNCLMEVAEKDGMEIIVITLKSNSIYPDTNKIINYAFDNFEAIPISDAGKLSYEYNNTPITLYSNEGISYISPKNTATSNTTTENNDAEKNITDASLEKNIKKEIVFNEPSGKVISSNEKVGQLNTYVNGKLYRSVDLFSAEDYDFNTDISFKFFINLGIFSAILIIIRLILNLIKYRKLKTKGYLKNSKFF